MKLVLPLIVGILVGAGGYVTQAKAQNYPWCAYYGSSMGGGGTNCGFTTFQQCQTTVSGIGGFCDRNTQYVPPPGPTPPGPQYRPRHRRHQQP
jgi:Protein of unknown function (DUF3551)